jgi:hypothetical protein
MTSHPDQESREELPFLLQLVEIRPAAAFCLIWMALIVANFSGYLLPDEWGIGPAYSIAFLTISGWQVLVSFRLKEEFGDLVRIHRKILVACLIYFSIFCLFAPWLVPYLETGQSDFVKALIDIGASLGLLCVLFIIWSATKALIAAERHPHGSVMRFVVTFLLFYCLPFGIIFTQRRLRKVLAV